MPENNVIIEPTHYTRASWDHRAGLYEWRSPLLDIELHSTSRGSTIEIYKRSGKAGDWQNLPMYYLDPFAQPSDERVQAILRAHGFGGAA